MDPTLIGSAQQITAPILQQIPGTLLGLERQEFIIKEIRNLNKEQRSLLKQLFEQLLEHMRQIGASDIDMGSYGCQGKVWFRIHGDKKPDDRLGSFKAEEMDVMFVVIKNDIVEIVFESIRRCHQCVVRSGILAGAEQ